MGKHLVSPGPDTEHQRGAVSELSARFPTVLQVASGSWYAQGVIAVSGVWTHGWTGKPGTGLGLLS